MGDSVESRKALDAKNRELEEERSKNSRLEREIYNMKSTRDQDKVHFNGEIGNCTYFVITSHLTLGIDRKEFDCQQLRDQLSLVTSQLEREREAHQEQMREKIQELVRFSFFFFFLIQRL